MDNRFEEDKSFFVSHNYKNSNAELRIRMIGLHFNTGSFYLVSIICKVYYNDTNTYNISNGFTFYDGVTYLEAVAAFNYLIKPDLHIILIKMFYQDAKLKFSYDNTINWITNDKELNRLNNRVRHTRRHIYDSNNNKYDLGDIIESMVNKFSV